MKQATLLAFCLVTVGAQAITIDDFSTAYSQSVLSGTWVDSTNAAVLGGERDVQLMVLGNPFNQFADMDLMPIAGIFSNGFGVTSMFTLQYDRAGDETGNTGAGKTLKNGGTGVALLPKGTNLICLTWIGNDLDVTATVTARLSGGVLGSASLMRPAGSGMGLTFLAVAGLDQADSITFDFSGATSADFALSSLKAVPEPTTWSALAAASLVFAARRRKR